MANTGDSAEERFAARIRHERTARGWRLEDLAAAAAAQGLPLHFTAYSKIENGLRPVSLNEAELIAAAFGVPLTYMLVSDNPGEVARELDEARAEFAEAQAQSDAELARAAAAWNRIQELVAALEQERGGYPSAGT